MKKFYKYITLFVVAIMLVACPTEIETNKTTTTTNRYTPPSIIDKILSTIAYVGGKTIGTIKEIQDYNTETEIVDYSYYIYDTTFDFVNISGKYTILFCNGDNSSDLKSKIIGDISGDECIEKIYAVDGLSAQGEQEPTEIMYTKYQLKNIDEQLVKVFCRYEAKTKKVLEYQICDYYSGNELKQEIFYNCELLNLTWDETNKQVTGDTLSEDKIISKTDYTYTETGAIETKTVTEENNSSSDITKALIDYKNGKLVNDGTPFDETSDVKFSTKKEKYYYGSNPLIGEIVNYIEVYDIKDGNNVLSYRIICDVNNIEDDYYTEIKRYLDLDCDVFAEDFSYYVKDDPDFGTYPFETVSYKHDNKTDKYLPYYMSTNMNITEMQGEEKVKIYVESLMVNDDLLK